MANPPYAIFWFEYQMNVKLYSKKDTKYRSKNSLESVYRIVQ